MKKAPAKASFLAVTLSLLAACSSPAPLEPTAPASTSQSILVKSSPSPGSTVSSTADKLELWFDPPARLHEVTVTGPEGMMPMMVTAVGEVGYYSLPLPGRSAGDYAVRWRATAAAAEHRGEFAFTVR